MDSTLAQLQAGRLAGTRRLDLSCGLQHFPREIFDLADSLEVLNLSDNALDSLPDDLPRLHRLRVLFCSANRFTTLPAVLGQCPQLEMVGFKSNRIAELPAAAFPPALRWLILTDNCIELLPAAIGNCARLQKLMLAGNRLRALPAQLASCQRLELLRIAANALTELPAWLATMPRLAWLAYAGNAVGEVPPAVSPASIDWYTLTLQQLLGEGASGVIHQARWEPPGAPAAAVAVKLFKGAVTSDGWPRSELAASLAAGAHPHLIPVEGRLAQHPAGTEGLVMQRVPPSFGTLAGPPSLASCTRDVYAAGVRFAPGVVWRIAMAAASAAAHLHARGILHGDLYAHNLQCDAEGRCVLGDMGAASFLPADPSQAQALQRLEVRAFGCLLEELLDHLDGVASYAAPSAWTSLRDACLQPDTVRRPLFAEIVQALQSAPLPEQIAG